ncbi:MAG: phosphoenolpyruvate synthase, partial [Dehalococcoidia bacterium]|nr:phosphoenolpyruvate synthase [Dehalococcoidia bacterium]
MKQGIKVVAWFDEVTKADIPLVGGKGANLGEMFHAGIPVPGGFIVTADAYFKFLEVAKLVDKIPQYLENLDVNDSEELQEVSKLIKSKISNSSVPADMIDEIKRAYRKLGGGPVAVRSSAT